MGFTSQMVNSWGFETLCQWCSYSTAWNFSQYFLLSDFEILVSHLSYDLEIMSHWQLRMMMLMVMMMTKICHAKCSVSIGFCVICSLCLSFCRYRCFHLCLASADTFTYLWSQWVYASLASRHKTTKSLNLGSSSGAMGYGKLLTCILMECWMSGTWVCGLSNCLTLCLA